MVVLSSEGRVLEWNSSAEILFSTPKEQVLGKEFFSIGAFAAMFQAERALFGEVLAGKPPAPTWERVIKRHTILWKAARVCPDTQPASAIIALGEDVTESRRADRLSLRAHQRERARVSVELHAGLGQQLVALSFMAEGAVRRIRQESPREAARISELHSLLGDAMEQARHLARGFYPPDLHKTGLLAAARVYATKIARLYQIDCKVDAGPNADPVRLPESSTAIHLYRILEEAMDMGASRGNTRSIHIRFFLDSSGLRLVIRYGCTRGLRAWHGWDANSLQHHATAIGARAHFRPSADGALFECVYPHEDPMLSRCTKSGPLR